MDVISYKKAKRAEELAEQIINGQIDVGVLQTKIDEKLNNLEVQYAPDLSNVKSQLADIAIHPKLLGAESDYTQAFTRAIDEVKASGKGTIILAQGKVYTGTLNTNEASNLIITGGGTLKGIINLYGKDMTTGNKFVDGSHDIIVSGITIDGETVRNAINCKWYMGVTIFNNKIINCLKAINFETVEVHQHSSRVKILGNTIVDCNYALYMDSAMAKGSFAVGDVTFNDNQCETRSSVFSNVYNIYVRGLDGLICKNNVFFFTTPGITNIYIDNFTWTNIEGNQFFEAAEHGIRCERGSNLSIVNNKFAWTKKESVYLKDVQNANITGGNNFVQKDDSGTSIANRTGIYITDCPFFNGVVSDNSFYFFNEHAIKIVNSTRIAINGNIMQNKYSLLSAISIDFATCSHINLGDNSQIAYTQDSVKTFLTSLGNNQKVNLNGNYHENLPLINRGVHVPIVGSYSDGSVTIDISGRELIILENPTATTITSFTTDSLIDVLPRIVTIYSKNANTSIAGAISNVEMNFIGGSGAVNIPAKGSITFLVYEGKIREISRSFPMLQIATISTTATTLDSSLYNQANLAQPSATTITDVTNGINGREMMLLAFNGNTTLQHNASTMRLKGAINVTIPTDGFIRLRYMSGRWYEISRNF